MFCTAREEEWKVKHKIERERGIEIEKEKESHRTEYEWEVETSPSLSLSLLSLFIFLLSISDPSHEVISLPSPICFKELFFFTHFSLSKVSLSLLSYSLMG